MKLYRAETGSAIYYDRKIVFENVDQLHQYIGKSTGIAPDSQIFITSHGSILNEDNFQQVYETTGDDEELVFCYNRFYWETETNIVEDFLAREIPGLEPEIPFHSDNVLKHIQTTIEQNTFEENCNRYIDFFEKLGSYSESILDTIKTHQLLADTTIKEQKQQSMALSTAIQHLSSYIKLTAETGSKFLNNAKEEMEKQTDLLKYFDDNMRILQNIKIHPPILELMEPESRDKNILFDFIDTQHIKLVKSETEKLCKELKERIPDIQMCLEKLTNYENQIKSDAETKSRLGDLDPIYEDIKNFSSNAVLCHKAFQSNLKGVFDKLISFKQDTLTTAFENFSLKRQENQYKRLFFKIDDFATYHLNDTIVKLRRNDSNIRKHVAKLIDCKKLSIRQFFDHMRRIADTLKYAYNLGGTCRDCGCELQIFKQKYRKNDLQSVSQVVLAYGALLIEIVRRKEYNQYLVKNSNIIANILSEYRYREEKRREDFRHKIKTFLPFNLIEFDQTPPQSEITINGSNQYDRILLDKKDVEEDISLLQNAYRRQSIISSAKHPSFASSSNVIKTPSFITTIKSIQHVENDEMMVLFDAMSNQLSGLKSEFLKIIELKFFTVGKIDPTRMKELLDQEDDSIHGAVSIIQSTTSSTYSVIVDDKKQIEVTINENNQLKDQVQQLKEQIEMYQISFKNLETEKEELESQVNNFDNERLTFEQNRQSFINELKNKDKTADFRIASAEEDFQSKISDLQYALEEERRMKKNLEIEHASELNTLQTDHANEIEDLKELVRQEAEKTQNVRDDFTEILRREQEKFQEERDEFEKLLKEEKQKTQDALDSKSKENHRADELTNVIQSLETNIKEEKQKTQDALDSKSKENHRADELTNIIQSLETNIKEEKQKYKDMRNNIIYYKSSIEGLQATNKFLKKKVDELEHKSEEKERKSEEKERKLEENRLRFEEIKRYQEHTKNMLATTEEDWRLKDKELKQIKEEQESVYKAIKSLLLKYWPGAKPEEEFDLKIHIELFKEKLAEFTKDSQEVRNNYKEITDELSRLSESHKILTEERFAWKSITSRMAERLEEFRKNVLYDLVMKLQLPIDENDMNILSRNLSPSDDDAVIWNEVLQLSCSIQTQTFVVSVLEHAKNLYDNYVVTKSQIRKMKEKQRHLLISNSEKISFRNFKVGDVALFLPTRNSTGKPWAAFNINAPHYFLRSDDTTSSQMQSREWIVARIVSITENTVNETHNPYGLALGLKYYDLEVENWRTNRPNKSKKRLIEPDSGLASLSTGNATPPKRPSFSSIASSSTNIVHSYVNK